MIGRKVLFFHFYGMEFGWKVQWLIEIIKLINYVIGEVFLTVLLKVNDKKWFANVKRNLTIDQNFYTIHSLTTNDNITR